MLGHFNITDMMEEGPRVIVRLPNIRQAIISHPEPLLWFSTKRMELEIMWLELRIKFPLCRNGNGKYDDTDIIMQEIKRQLNEIVQVVRLRMLMEGSILNEQHIIFSRLLMYVIMN
ncbi:hypothetical protein DPMN_092795 [Dreissena polymorpha]|uniref:Uncharacterized protein n=1 Tax=Dreissena polymorpha TaxID=45954 RepID=A0A9D4L339_DREPO|nr:hypothetical protein DPMN_092795 [Dreissena polymorpha]